MLGSSRYIEQLSGVVEPVTLAEAKLQLRLDYSDEDAIIAALISSTRKECENYLYTALINQRRVALFDCFGPLTAMGPVIEVESVEYLNTSNEWTTVAATEYIVTPDVVLRLFPVTSWPVDVNSAPGSVRVTYTCGPGDSDPSPVIKTAMLLKITDAYSNRENPTRAKRTLADSMLDLERINVFS